MLPRPPGPGMHDRSGLLYVPCVYIQHVSACAMQNRAHFAPFNIHRPAHWQPAARRTQFMQSRLPDGGEAAETAEAAGGNVIRQAEELVAQAVEESLGHRLMLRASQGRVSPLDGVTPSCCPTPLLQLATQCCALDPEARPALAAVLEQLQGEVLSAVDASESVARRPQPPLAGWRNATWLVKVWLLPLMKTSPYVPSAGLSRRPTATTHQACSLSHLEDSGDAPVLHWGPRARNRSGICNSVPFRTSRPPSRPPSSCLTRSRLPRRIKTTRSARAAQLAIAPRTGAP